MSASINYDEVLDDWAEEVYKRMDKLTTKLETLEFGSLQYGACKGQIDGYAMSLAIFSRVEKKAKRRTKKEMI